MVSHCTASLKLTPWHEGTFASAVIYSPPRPPPLTASPLSSLVSNPLTLLPPSRSCLKNDIHYFIVKQQSFFSRSPGTRRQGKREENEAPTGQITARPGSAEAIGALLFVTRGPRWKWQCVPLWRQRRYRLSGEIQLHVWGTGCWVRAGREGDCLSESLWGFRPAPITDGPDHGLTRSQIFSGIVRSSRKHN